MYLYKTINWYEKNTNELFELMYNKLDKEDQYPFFSWLMQHFPDLNIDWLEIFEDLSETLIQNKKIDALLSFTDWYKIKDPKDYNEKFEFIERDLCDYFFFIKDEKKLYERIEFIQQNPVSAIDTLTIRLLYQLIYHGYYNAAICYAKAVWKPINESDQLYGFPAYPFINSIYVSQLQNYYEAGLNGIHLDENELFRQMVSMGYDEDISRFNEVMQALKDDLSVDEIKESIKKGINHHMLILNIHFLKHMLHSFQLPFVFSEWIWNFIATTKIFGKQKGVENWFYVNVKTMDEHLSKSLDSFMGSNDLEIFGKVWGLDFVFDFLHEQQLLSSEHYENMKENIAYLRNEMILFTGDLLWQMMFVFDWPLTNNQSVDLSEKRLFYETYGKENSEALEKINRIYSNYQVPKRVQKELKLKDVEESHPFPIFSENMSNINSEHKTGRNDLCPCGSGKKFKKCCLNK